MSIQSNELKKYQQLIDESFFDEAFQVLAQEVAKIEDVIEQKRVIRMALSYPLQESKIIELANRNQLNELATAMNKTFDKPNFEDLKGRLSTIISNKEASKIVSVAIIENNFDVAKTFMPYAIKDLSVYKTTIETVTNANNVEGLRFMCENFDNIHFDSGELLARAADMKTDALKMLIDEFNFDFNTQARPECNLVLNLITQGNTKNFEWLNKNYGTKINYNFELIYKLIEKENKLDFYSIMLTNPNLKQVHVEKIGNYLFTPKVIDGQSHHDIYEKFFTHKSFDDQTFALGQGYFIYGLLSKIGNVAKRESNDTVRNYVRVLDAYMNTLEEDTIPDSPEFHIVGAAVHVAKVGDTPGTNEACIAVLRRFPRYINKPNPSALLPIQQVEKDSYLYQMLINNGAVTPEPEPTFWTNVLNVFAGKKNKKEAVVEDTQTIKENKASETSIGIIRIKMKNDFRTMQDYLLDELCDASIKMKCENMFLKADKLSMVMEKKNLNSYGDELHFLSENFAKYLKSSLKAYIELSHAAYELENNPKKLEEAKKLCMEHVNLLTEQLDLITSNISNGLSQDALIELKASGKFLEERFNKTLNSDSNVESTEDNDVVQVRPLKPKN
jgi:hypothetical protein